MVYSPSCLSDSSVESTAPQQPIRPCYIAAYSWKDLPTEKNTSQPVPRTGDSHVIMRRPVALKRLQANLLQQLQSPLKLRLGGLQSRTNGPAQ